MLPLLNVEKDTGIIMISAELMVILTVVPFHYLDQPLKAMFGLVIANMVSHFDSFSRFLTTISLHNALQNSYNHGNNSYKPKKRNKHWYAA